MQVRFVPCQIEGQLCLLQATSDFGSIYPPDATRLQTVWHLVEKPDSQPIGQCFQAP
jgi:hypothetical protein